MLFEKQSSEIKRLETLADWLDTKFRLPGTQFRFGIDAIIGLFPFFGDSITALTTVYLLGIASQLGVPGRILIQIALNGIIDWLAGSVPLFGDLFDFGFKANRRNVDLIRRYLVGRPNDETIEGEVIDKKIS